MIGLLAVWVGWLQEPRYEGKKLSEWLDLLPKGSYPLQDGDKVARIHDAIRQIAAKGLPFLVKWLQGEDGPRRDAARDGLSILGPQAAPALPALNCLIHDWRSHAGWTNAVDVLRFMGPAGASTLMATLTNRDYPIAVRYRAAESIPYLYDMLTNGSPLVPALAVCLQETQESLAVSAARTLCFYRFETRSAIAVLLRSVQSTNPAVALEAVSALDSAKFQPDNAVATLVEALQHTDSQVASRAAEVLAKFQAHPELSVPALVRSLEDHRPAVRCAAARALGCFDEAANPAIPALVKAQADPDTGVRYEATNALSNNTCVRCAKVD